MTNEATPIADAKIDAEGALSMLAALMNAANQTTSGSTAGTSGNTNQMGSGTNASEVSVQSMADINTPESLSAYTGLAVKEATGHGNRLDLMGEQIIQNAIEAGKQITQNAISQTNKRTVDMDTVSHFLDMQGVRNNDVATDRIWNLDEQIAAAEVLYAALGRYLSSTNVTNPAA